MPQLDAVQLSHELSVTWQCCHASSSSIIELFLLPFLLALLLVLLIIIVITIAILAGSVRYVTRTGEGNNAIP